MLVSQSPQYSIFNKGIDFDDSNIVERLVRRCVLHIFSKTRSYGILKTRLDNFSHVSKQWNLVVNSIKVLLFNEGILRIKNCDEKILTDYLHKYSYVSHLRLWQFPPDKIIEISSKFPHIVITHINIKDNEFSKISNLNLTALDLTGCKSITKGYEALSKLTKLQSLVLFNNNFGDDAIKKIEPLINLKVLDLSHCMFTDEGFAHCKNLINLTALDLSYCKHLTDKSICNIVQLTNLTDLSLKGLSVTDGGIICLSRLINITSLDLLHVKKPSANSINNLTKLPSLLFLRINYSPMIDRLNGLYD